MPRSQMAHDGHILDCLKCGRNFHKRGYEGLMEWANHVCQPITLTNYMGDWDPVKIVTPTGATIEYRWVCKLPGNKSVT